MSPQVLTAILFNPYEDKPTVSLSSVLGSRRGFGFDPGDSSQLFSSPAIPFLLYSELYKSSLNGLIDLKERKDSSFSVYTLSFSSERWVSSLQSFDSALLHLKFLTKPILVFHLLPRKVQFFFHLIAFPRNLFCLVFFVCQHFFKIYFPMQIMQMHQ